GLGLADDLDAPAHDHRQVLGRIALVPDEIAALVVGDVREHRDAALVFWRESAEDRQRADRARNALGSDLGRGQWAPRMVGMTGIIASAGAGEQRRGRQAVTP